MTNTRALLLMDYQVALCEEGPHLRMPPLAAQVAERDVLATAEKVLSAARTAGWLVVHVRLAFDPTYTLRTNRLARFDAYPDQKAMLADSPEAQIVGQLAPIAGEPVIDKGCVDPFVGTPLRDVLAAEGITEVVLGGVATNLVVESAARHASDAGLQVTVVEDMCASFRADFHDFSVQNMLPLFGTVTTAADLLGELVMGNDYDVAVVGGGVAGLTAACAAAEAGARVAILERSTEAETGGNTRYTEAFLRMKSLEETSDGLEDTLVDDFMGHPDPSIMADAARSPDRRSPLYKAHHAVDPDYVAELAASAPETLAWMGTHGVRYGFLPTPFLTTSTTRMAPVGGGLAIVETMGKAARGLGVEFHFETTARSLAMNGGEVVGVLADTPVGRITFGGRVVLASGGYQGNAEMMARYHGDRAMTSRPVARGGNYNKGEGIEMALAVGAATAGNFSLFHAEPVDPRSGEPEAAIFAFPYGVLVNAEGERFVDEARGPIDAWYERTTRDISAQTGGIAWVVLDQQALAVPNIRSGIRTDIAPVVADTVVELATDIGVPPQALVETLSAYDAACGDGDFDPTTPDGLATSGLVPPKSNWARPVSEGPFEAYPIMAANVFTFGGLKTTAAAEVVDNDGGVVRGLWAAGEMTGLYYANYTGSTSVLRGATFGRIAGREAARG